MPPGEDTESNDPRTARLDAETSAGAHSPAELGAALEGLDRATRNFARLLGDADGPSGVPPSGRAAEPTERRARTPDAALAARMREAEREARAYLEQAKRRADSLVRSMVAAVEHESAEIRRGAEEGVQQRRRQAEVDAAQHLEEARLVADAMVAERQAQLAALSDGISGRARALIAGMDDAERVRGQFDLFVRALSATADRIARDDAPQAASPAVRDLPRTHRPTAIAA